MKKVFVMKNRYMDSVSLMVIAVDLTALPGVTAAECGLGTKQNIDLITEEGYTVPEGVTKMSVEIRTGKTAQSTFSINPGTGLDLNAGSFTATATVEMGKTVDMAAYILLSSNEEAIDIKITALDKDSKVLYIREKEDVPFQQAYLTKATGTFFSATATTSLNFVTGLSGTKEIDL